MQLQEPSLMDTPKPAATRVRHILQAMERSIDSARSRRTNTPATPAHSGGIGGVSNAMDTSVGGRAQNASLPHASHSMNAHMQRSTLPQTPSFGGAARSAQHSGLSPLIGGNAAAARVPLTPVDPNQPAKLKAKPKRFESTFAAQLAQNPQTDYRSQTG
jgi:hypothetical protein